MKVKPFLGFYQGIWTYSGIPPAPPKSKWNVAESRESVSMNWSIKLNIRFARDNYSLVVHNLIMNLLYFDSLLLWFCESAVFHVKIVLAGLINRTIGHAQDLWNVACSCKQLRLLCPSDPWNLPETALLSGFKNFWGTLKSTELDNT